MATSIRIITAKDFLEVTTDGIIDIGTSRKLLKEIAKISHLPVAHELFVDFRDTQSHLSIFEVYQLAAELGQYGETFHRKVALLVLPGLNFDRASFFETCSNNRGFEVQAFTDYEPAMRWILAPEDKPSGTPPVPPGTTDAGTSR